MKRVVFYSWQSDLPNACNRGFIQDALENAAAAITADDTVAIEPVIDRDTQGIPGSPDISSAIFAKITAAEVFVADISIVARPQSGRVTPNPNVLIELGYAFKALGSERVILIFNRAFGMIEELPFDLRMRRVVPYDMSAEARERATEKKRLEKLLNSAIRSALVGIPEREPAAGNGGLDRKSEMLKRVKVHEDLILPKLEDIKKYGFVGMYCYPAESVALTVEQLQQFLNFNRMKFAEEICFFRNFDIFQNGVSVGYFPDALHQNTKSTYRITLQVDGFAALDTQGDVLMRGEHQMHLGWLIYEFQRYLQLTKALFMNSRVSGGHVLLDFKHIDQFSLLFGGMEGFRQSARYGGRHDAIYRDVNFRDVHDHEGAQRNIVMPVVQDVIAEVCRIFGLSRIPAGLWDQSGYLFYVKGLETSR